MTPLTIPAANRHPAARRSRLILAFAPLAALLTFSESSLAQQQWDSGGANNNWSTAANWNTDTVPANNGTANITFGAGARTAPNADVAWNLNTLTFQVASPAFTLGGQNLTIQSGGILNSSVAAQTVNNPITLGAPQTWNAFLGNLNIGTTSSTLTNNGFQLTVDGANTTAISAAIAGTGGITKNGSGTLSITGAGNTNTFTGTTFVNSGTLALSKSALSNDSAITGNLVIGDGTGTDIVRLDANYQLRDSIAVTVNSSGILNANGRTDDFTTLTMHGGTITTGTGQIGLYGDLTTLANAADALISGNLALNGTRTFNVASGSAATDLNIPAAVSGGGIIKTGPGVLRLAGSNSFTGGLTVSSGAVVLGTNTAAGTGMLTLGNSRVTAEGSRILTNQTTLAGNTTFAGTDTIHFTGAATLTGNRQLDVLQQTTISGAIGESAPGFGITLGSVASANQGTLTLSGTGANSFSGTTTVNSGTLQLAKAGGAAALAGPLVVGDGFGGPGADVVRYLNNDQSANGVFTINDSGLLDLNGYHQSSDAITMTGGNIATGTAGELYLNGLSSITAQAAANPATISGRMTFSTFNYNGLSVADGSPAVDLDIPAAIGGGGESVAKTGTGTLRLSGNNTFGGDFRLMDGTLLAGSNSALGTSRLYIGGGAGTPTLGADGGPRTISNTLEIFGNAFIGGSAELNLSGMVYLNGASPFYFVVNNSAPTTISGSLQVPAGASVSYGGWGDLAVTGSAWVAGTFHHADGRITADNFFIAPTGSLRMSTGILSYPTFAGKLTNMGVFTYDGGTFNGRLINSGTMQLNTDFTAGNGLENRADYTVTAGRRISLNGAGLDNQAALTLAGGEISGNGPLTNNGLLGGVGVISGNGGFVNNGLLQQGDGTLTFQNSGPSYNYGAMQLTTGRQFQMQSGSFNNQGTLATSGALITGAGSLMNRESGVLSGTGTITAPFSNTGTVVPGPGTLNVVPSWANGGIVQLTGPLSNLTGGTIVNSGIIQGNGSVGAPVVNSGGTIEALGGTLALNGTLENQTGSVLAASTGNKLLATRGLTNNAGLITLTGGTFDNAGRPLINTGNIAGYGTLRTGGLTNNGNMTLTGGVTTITGPVTNGAGHEIHVAWDSFLFTGDVVNNGIFRNTEASVTFAGNYTENGTYISDPADNFFRSLNVGELGALVGGAGDRFILRGSLITTSRQNARWDTRLSELRFSGPGEHNLTVNGSDFGYSDTGFAANFSWGAVHLETGALLTLMDDVIPGGALYAGVFAMDDGLQQLTSIDSGGLNIYYDPRLDDNRYLGGQTFVLAGGGRLAPVPEPGCIC